MHRGRLNSAKDGIDSGTLRFQQQWMLDPLGNWDQFNQDDNGEGWDLKQQRQHNLVNEITAISASEGPTWLNPEYDAAGNTRHIPNPKVTDKYFQATYDAWNRLVRVIDGKRLAEYEYDGRGFCTRRRAYDGEDNLTATFDDYYTNDWRLIETRVTHAGTTTAHLHEQYVWSHSADAYVDSLILRDRDSNGNGQLNERLYTLQDANYNVIGVADPAQSESPVVERYAYSAYGQRMILADDFTERVASVFEWIVGHQGLRHEVAIGLIQNGARYLHPNLGRFITRDTGGYIDGPNLYQYVGSNPTNYVDPDGLWLRRGDRRDRRRGRDRRRRRQGDDSNFRDVDGYIWHFYFGGGTDLSVPASQYKRNSDVQDFIAKVKQHIDDNAPCCPPPDTWSDKMAKGIDVTDTVFVLGRGKLNADIKCDIGDNSANCRIHFYVRDRFTDPLDLGQSTKFWIPSWIYEVGGRSYNLNVDWYEQYEANCGD